MACTVDDHRIMKYKDTRQFSHDGHYSIYSISAFSKTVKVRGQEYQLELVDTAGQVKYNDYLIKDY